MPPETSAADPMAAFAATIGLISILAVIGFVALIVSRARKLSRILKSSPRVLSFDADPTPSAGPDERSTEFRLATLDTLMMQGRITPDEYREARAKVLGESS